MFSWEFLEIKTFLYYTKALLEISWNVKKKCLIKVKVQHRNCWQFLSKLKGEKLCEGKQFVIYSIPQLYVTDSQWAAVCVASVTIFITQKQLEKNLIIFF